MTQVDFYITDDQSEHAQALLACRLTEKAYKLGHRVHINAQSMDKARQLDTLMWEFRQGSFIPHYCVDNETDELAPVSIGAGEAPAQQADVLVNLANEIPSWKDQCQRIAEIVDGNTGRRQASRQKYKLYRQQGCSLQTHELNR